MSPTSSPTPSAGQTVTVTITTNGLSRQNLNLKVGDHPTHLACPGFDPLRGLTQGETFSFTFNQAGICPFHDHLNARKEIFNGVIIVEGGK